jgi:hypothetical protein
MLTHKMGLTPLFQWPQRGSPGDGSSSSSSSSSSSDGGRVRKARRRRVRDQDRPGSAAPGLTYQEALAAAMSGRFAGPATARPRCVRRGCRPVRSRIRPLRAAVSPAAAPCAVRAAASTPPGAEQGEAVSFVSFGGGRENWPERGRGTRAETGTHSPGPSWRGRGGAIPSRGSRSCGTREGGEAGALS